MARPSQWRRRRGPIDLLLVAMALLVGGCVTRAPSLRGWSVGPGGDGFRLAYGPRDSDRPDFAVICDLSAGVADLVYRAAPTPGMLSGTRTELLIAVGEQVDTIPAEVAEADERGVTVVARTRLPPAPVAEWAGQRLTVAAVGTASTFLVRPSNRQIRTFLNGCNGGQSKTGPP